MKKVTKTTAVDRYQTVLTQIRINENFIKSRLDYIAKVESKEVLTKADLQDIAGERSVIKSAQGNLLDLLERKDAMEAKGKIIAVEMGIAA